MVLRLLAVRRPQNRVRHVKKQVDRQSLMHFGAKNDGFMINLRFDLGEKSRGVVKPLFSPMPKGDAEVRIAELPNCKSVDWIAEVRIADKS